MLSRDLSRLAICIGAVLLASAIGSFATVRAIPTWYKGLAKPSFNPPGWLFGPAWTVLYHGLSPIMVTLFTPIDTANSKSRGISR